MESYSLNVFGRIQGSLLQNRTTLRANGPILTITNDTLPRRKKIQKINFIRMCVNRTGSFMAAGDSQGHIYAFDLRRKTFWLVHRFNNLCTAMSFASIKGKNLIVALSDCAVVTIDTELKGISDMASKHKSCVSHVSVNDEGCRALTSSRELAVLWDLRTFTVLHSLTLKKEVDILKVFFLPVKDYIVSAFKDDSVFLWDSTDRKYLGNFRVESDNELINMRTIDGSSDGTLLTCGGRATWVYIWNVDKREPLCIISLSNYLTCVRQLWFLPPLSVSSTKNHILCILSQVGVLHIYNIDTAEHIHVMYLDDGRFLSVAVSGKSWKIAAASSSGHLLLYDVSLLLQPKVKHKVQKTDLSSSVPKLIAKKQHNAVKKKPKIDKSGPEFELHRMYALVRKFGEYPEKYRLFIWSKLLKLPSNKESFQALLESGLKDLCFMNNKGFPIANRTLKRAFIRIISMLFNWCPLLQEIDYIPYLVFPFVKLLHTNMLMCFELVVTLISSWCQNWFMFSPFPPHNIFCMVESIFLQHNVNLLMHFARYDITANIYAWPLLQTGFSDVFSKDNFLKLWDNIFSNPPEFLLYVVVAYSTVSQHLLLQCQLQSDFRAVYNKEGVSVTTVIKEAYRLQDRTTPDLIPNKFVGNFCPIPEGAYPLLNRIPHFEANFQVQARKRILHDTVHNLKKSESEIELEAIAHELHESNEEEIKRVKSNRWSQHMHELQRLSAMRRSILLQYIEIQPIPTQELENKLIRIQGLIKKTLTDQMEKFSYEILSPKDALTEKEEKNELKSVRIKDFPQHVEIELMRFDGSTKGVDSMKVVKDALSLRKELVEEEIKRLHT